MADATRYFVYVRKSTDDKSRQVRSIEEQQNELREVVKRNNLRVVGEFEERMSAKRAGRPVFNEMLARIEAGEANGIISWHADRLSRNSLDGARIIQLFDIRKLNRLQFYAGFVENTPQGKMLLNAEFGFSKYYVDSLSENVQRGHRDKIAHGEYPSLAPLGYLNDSRMKRIVVDRDRAPAVKKAFELYATGTATLDDVCRLLGNHGIVTRRTRSAEGGKLVTRRSVSKLLSNPLYYGHFRYQGELYAGTHEPLVGKALFDAVQTVLDSRFRYSVQTVARVEKSLVGLFRCVECGCSITAEIQKGHIYYRCSKKRRNQRCAQPYVREESLAEQLSTLLASFVLPQSMWDKMRVLFETERAQAATTAAILSSENRASVRRLSDRLQRLKEGYLDRLYSGDAYRSDKDEIMGEIATLDEQYFALRDGKYGWLELLGKWISEAQTIGEIATRGLLTEKRDLARKIFGSNLVLDLKKARGEAANPWALLANNAGGYDTAHIFTLARTWFQGRHVLPELESNRARASAEVSPPRDTLRY